jgi:hypothetical protein
MVGMNRWLLGGAMTSVFIFATFFSFEPIHSR